MIEDPTYLAAARRALEDVLCSGLLADVDVAPEVRIRVFTPERDEFVVDGDLLRSVRVHMEGLPLTAAPPRLPVESLSDGTAASSC